MTPVDNEQINKLLEKIHKHKVLIEINRDQLREISNELRDLIETFDEGIEGLEDGSRQIEDAVDALSKLI
ncbi:MAG: hypothetical protein KJO69_02190 [Gammaproteobacteria bacterium]|nr:hypothetical protein [Gammaproteobacteria bacterium]